MALRHFTPKFVARHLRGSVVRRFAREGNSAKHRQNLAQDEEGLALVEFALILPILILALLGSVDLTRALMADRKLSTMSSSIGDLIAREDVVDEQTVQQIFQAVTPLMTPFNAGNAEVRVSSLEVIDNGNSKQARVLWSRGKNKAPRGEGSTVPVPEEILDNTQGLVYVEGGYQYQPLFGLVLTGPIDFDEDFYFIPRVAGLINME